MNDKIYRIVYAGDDMYTIEHKNSNPASETWVKHQKMCLDSSSIYGIVFKPITYSSVASARSAIELHKKREADKLRIGEVIEVIS